MMDHTFNGVPVSQVPTAKIIELLNEGFTVKDPDGRSIKEAEECVMKRLKLELEIRKLV